MKIGKAEIDKTILALGTSATLAISGVGCLIAGEILYDGTTLQELYQQQGSAPFPEPVVATTLKELRARADEEEKRAKDRAEEFYYSDEANQGGPLVPISVGLLSTAGLVAVGAAFVEVYQERKRYNLDGVDDQE